MELSITQIAEKLGGQIEGNRTLMIRGVAPFSEADHDQITLAEGPKFIKKLDQTKAGAVIVPLGTESNDKTVIKVENPRLIFAKTLEMFHPDTVKGEKSVHMLDSLHSNTRSIVYVDNETTDSFVGWYFCVSFDKQEIAIRNVCTRGPDFLPVNHPLITLEFRLAFHGH